ncbi:MAG: ABC transporter ATP-binding protein, partial [Cellulosilyticum sp.]|nr:ABC transporter ATP-binding protein [Cellulosilyticum sp.]
MNKRKKSTVSWIKEFASVHQWMYVMSIIVAIIGVFCSMIPYVYMGNMIKELIEGNKDLSFYMNECLWMAVFWG